jgi:two-component system cell cycle sensor histidine kinase/response regulator CckA
MENEQAATRKKRVLVVDDDLELTLIYQHLLEAYNYEVSTASDGILALKQVLHQDVDAVLCDLRMPELEGDLFYGAVERAKPDLCRRFIFITGVADDPKYQPFLSQMKSPILRKPVPPAKLLAELQKLLESRA